MISPEDPSSPVWRGVYAELTAVIPTHSVGFIHVFITQQRQTVPIYYVK